MATILSNSFTFSKGIGNLIVNCCTNNEQEKQEIKNILDITNNSLELGFKSLDYCLQNRYNNYINNQNLCQIEYNNRRNNYINNIEQSEKELSKIKEEKKNIFNQIENYSENPILKKALEELEIVRKQYSYLYKN